MSIRITGIRLEGGVRHEHIVQLWWIEDGKYIERNDSKAQLVTWIEQGVKAYVEDRDHHRVDVRVVTPPHGQKFLRTHADGIPTDNLLALPRK